MVSEKQTKERIENNEQAYMIGLLLVSVGVIKKKEELEMVMIHDLYKLCEHGKILIYVIITKIGGGIRCLIIWRKLI